MALRVRCKCGKALKIPSQLAGKKISCPGCQKVFRIPVEKFVAAEKRARATQGTATPKPVVVAAPSLPLDDPAMSPSELDLLGEVGLSTSDMLPNIGSAMEGPAIDTKPCPSCMVPMAATARLCTACGFDMVKGKAAKAAGGGAGVAAASAAKGLAKATGGFVLGVVLSGVGAAIGGGIWFLVGWYIGREIGYIAIGVGVLSGLGICIAGQGGTTRAGVVAAGMSAASIVAAKLAIFFFLVAAFVTGDTSSPELKKEIVVAAMTEEILDQRGAKAESERKAKWDDAEKEARKRVRAMKASEFEAKLAECKNRKEDEVVDSEAAAADPSPEGPGSDAPTEPAADTSTPTKDPGILGVFFETMFSPMDLLFLFLALMTSYRIGVQGSTGSLSD